MYCNIYFHRYDGGTTFNFRTWDQLSYYGLVMYRFKISWYTNQGTWYACSDLFQNSMCNINQNWTHYFRHQIWLVHLSWQPGNHFIVNHLREKQIMQKMSHYCLTIVQCCRKANMTFWQTKTHEHALNHDEHYSILYTSININMTI